MCVLCVLQSEAIPPDEADVGGEGSAREDNSPEQTVREGTERTAGELGPQQVTLLPSSHQNHLYVFTTSHLTHYLYLLHSLWYMCICTVNETNKPLPILPVKMTERGIQ